MSENHNASRRGVLKSGLTILAGTVIAATAARAQDDSKVDQSVVQYQATPKDGQQCSLCVNYVDPGACKVVKGTIAPTGWCVAFAPKGS